RRERHGEGKDVLALLGEAQEPLPAQGDTLLDPVFSLQRAPDAAEVDPGMGLDPGDQRQEARVQHGDAHTGETGDRAVHGDDLQRDRPRPGAVVYETTTPAPRGGSVRSGRAGEPLAADNLTLIW